MLSIGIDIGGTKVAAGVVDESGTILRRLRRPTPSRSPEAVENAIVESVDELSTGLSIGAVGIGAAGWVDTEQALVRFSPHLAWRNEPLRDRLTTRIPVPVLVDNDANAAAWAEFRFGAGRGSRVMVCLTLGTGIGGALVINGRLFRGRYGMAGEFGHMTVVPDGHWCPCGNRGCWEQYASGNALVRDTRALIEEGSPRAQGLIEHVTDHDPARLVGPDVTAAAVDGDQMAIELIADVGHWLGLGMADLAAALDPDLFVIGGGVSDAGELLLAPARTAFGRHLTGRGFRPMAEIEHAAFGPDAGLIGAADLARHSITEPPGPARGFWPRRRNPRRARPRRRPIFQTLTEGFAAPSERSSITR
ncbi:ROK family glucokinase [Acidipropionibacterium jensenii]|uniref:Glucokinase n=3 Tax=Acidipropionibacterium jensenii TaxID=1749 RepID=A0A3S5EV37_9ACTN|nr:ROK family glucokinase [Acidipropionibacterium jensenii]AZZ39813.1 glucokinase [Acidipropionibacterium jensenii]AZZ41784.1 glucokinase [Acidipropionibacterium jensenii]MDN5977739.1 ROK family glucokinase [Acidipropionibacterium jensenii]MDN6441583.1 ROK family glucokinase [Acidipropionibacterium jensenii]MDN6761682.1 ROK family glucokinase [Acidipropionibacterium jensenii]